MVVRAHENDMYCPVQNKRQFSKREAAGFINFAKNCNQKNRNETRYYKCPHCDYYHVSKSDDGPDFVPKDLDKGKQQPRKSNRNVKKWKQ